ncbi:photosystem II repair PSB27- chloroplastic [Chlorella sorokiniana]|uniref:Photosystem II repair PSB27-chloroplastic n=1 Tax=Chlorella sorokiniana TaxID=3076 RepID=A0A2P6TWH8_CHLSO|nr:photosystem II repair PSB27- chloroplastic [Chlorella sorokiniana]|eukprot:PRW58412.1 photosystem II repair PSB27- chloroplastic [Chlorella sorokiniana]
MHSAKFFPWPGGFAKSELPCPVEPPRLGAREPPLADSPLEDEAEEWRLAHVACTRAKRLHAISYPSAVVDGRGRQLPVRRSKFLDEMLCALEEGRGMAGVMSAMASIIHAKPFVAAVSSSRRPQQPVACSAARQEQQPELARRSLLAGLALLAAAAPSAPSIAMASRWDGESSAVGSCALGAAGDECRLRILQQDQSKLDSYESTANETGKIGGMQSGVPVATLDAAYVKSTVQLTDKILAYASFADPVDPARLQIIKELKAEMPAWVSKYARGGSARTVSARKLYVVADAISGHFASNGVGPLPSSKLNKLKADVEAVRELLAQGK